MILKLIFDKFGCFIFTNRIQSNVGLDYDFKGIPCPELMVNGDAACRPLPIMSHVLIVGSCMLEGDIAFIHRLPQELSPLNK